MNKKLDSVNRLVHDGRWEREPAGTKRPLVDALNPTANECYEIKRQNGEEWMFVVDFVVPGPSLAADDSTVFYRAFKRDGEIGKLVSRSRMTLPSWRTAIREALKEAKS